MVAPGAAFVAVVDALTDDGVTIPAGTEGTIVGVWGLGEQYLVEVAEPEGTVLNLNAESVAFVGRHAP